MAAAKWQVLEVGPEASAGWLRGVSYQLGCKQLEAALGNTSVASVDQSRRDAVDDPWDGGW